MEKEKTIAALREFNRFYARFLGVFDKYALRTNYTLAQARILIELGRHPGCTANSIALYLDMDRSYTARIIKGFVQEGLLEKRDSEADGRKKCLWLTTLGQQLHQQLELRSDERIRQQLQGIVPEKRARLAKAMTEIQQILAEKPAEKIELRLGYESLDDVRALFQEYTDFLQVDLKFQHYDEELRNPAKKYAMPAGRLYVVYVDEKPAGCIAFHALGERDCEIKRLFVRPNFRGRGLARLLMERALQDAREQGYAYAYLDTLATLKSAVAMYGRMDFEEIGPYYENPLPQVKYYRKKLCNV